MVKIENSKRTILNLAESLLQDKGYNGFSYAHIASELGVKNAAIHYHFPTKEDLSIAVIQRYRDRFKLWTNNSRIKDLPHEGKLDWFLSIYSDWCADKGKVGVGGGEDVIDCGPAVSQPGRFLNSHSNSPDAPTCSLSSIGW